MVCVITGVLVTEIVPRIPGHQDPAAGLHAEGLRARGEGPAGPHDARLGPRTGPEILGSRACVVFFEGLLRSF